MPRLARALAAFLLVSGVGVAVSAAPAGASRSDAGHGAIVVRPGHSIQAAIDAAHAGDTIVVRRGTYHENLNINKDGITLVGWDATLVPAAQPRSSACSDPSNPGAVSGICVAGDFVSGPNGTQVTRYVRNVSVIGLTVKGFSEVGIFSAASDGTRVIATKLLDDGGYGVFANTAKHTLIAFNRARNNTEAGIYIGDSPRADATVIANDSAGATSGVFVRNAEHVTLLANRLHDNCVGTLVLADAPGPAGNVLAVGNLVEHNNKLCPPTPDDPSATSGVGFALAGAHDVRIEGNFILNNRASGAVKFQGGVVVATGGPGGTAPAHNTVVRNIILGNSPDLFSDGTGSGNTFRSNLCRTSVPAGLCGR